MIQPRTGDRINNYLLDEPIGAGTFGQVWRAHHHVFKEPVAIKVPTDPAYVRHLRREGLAIHGLRHPNIVRAMDLDPYADPAYLIVEYVDGPSVRQLIDAHAGGLPVAATVAVLYGTLSALEVAHEAGVIHRDIKPGNILIAGGSDLEGMTPARVKVADFGLRALEAGGDGSMMQSGSLAADGAQRIAGTIAYMSPEQRDGRELDPRSDLYSVGVVLHEMLTGALPQGTDLPSSLRPEVPRWLDVLFERTYTRRDHRFGSAREILDLIRRHDRRAEQWDRPASVGRKAVAPEASGHPCPGCGGLADVNDQFCIYCGRQLVARIRRCPSCHGYVGQADSFCVLCGGDLRELT